MYVEAGGTKLAQSKNEAFDKLERPNTWGDLRMIIGIFRFYIQFLPLNDLETIPWRYIWSNQPQPGALSQKEEMELMKKIWNIEDQMLL